MTVIEFRQLTLAENMPNILKSHISPCLFWMIGTEVKYQLKKKKLLHIQITLILKSIAVFQV